MVKPGVVGADLIELAMFLACRTGYENFIGDHDLQLERGA
jgi:hypothetical protein